MEDFFTSACVFDYRGFCYKGDDCLKKHRQCLGESCLKRHPKNCIFFTTFRDCKFAAHCRYHHEGRNTYVTVELKANIKEVEKL